MKRFVVIVPLLLLAGCSGELGCSDGATKSGAMEVITSNLSQDRWYQEMLPGLNDMKISNIQTISVDNTSKQHECHATLSWNYKGRDHSTGFDYETDYLEDKGKSEVRVDMNKVTSSLMVSAMW
jgi:hypothetical protein